MKTDQTKGKGETVWTRESVPRPRKTPLERSIVRSALVILKRRDPKRPPRVREETGGKGKGRLWRRENVLCPREAVL